jgi:membrane-bound ClpP family serine protease
LGKDEDGERHMAHVQDQHNNNAPNPGDGSDWKTSNSKTSKLRYITGIVLLILGAVVLLANLTISELGSSQSMVSFVGIVLVALGVTFLVTHFEDPDATLTGQAPFMKKIGIYARGYILLLGVLLGGGLVFVFYVLDPLEAERVTLLKDQKALKELNEDILKKT